MPYIGLFWEYECGLKNDLYAKNWKQMGVQVEQSYAINKLTLPFLLLPFLSITTMVQGKIY